MKNGVRVIYTGVWAERKLNELGLDGLTIRDVLQYGAAEEATYTEFDALGAGEYARWSRHVRRLSELLVPQNWIRINPDCQPTLVHPGQKWCIVVTSGTGATGVVYGKPTTKNPKGRSIRRAVANNAELSLFRPQDFEPAYEGLRETWLLMTYVNGKGEIQSEVSYPRSMEGEFISEFEHRILLPNTDPLLDPFKGSGNEEPPDYDFNIVRK